MKMMHNYFDINEYRLISDNQALEFLNNNKNLVKSQKILMDAMSDPLLFIQYWYDYESEYNTDGCSFIIKKQLINITNKDNTISIYMLLDKIYKKLFVDKKKIINYQEADINGSNAIFKKGTNEVLEQFVTVTQDEFNEYLKAYPRDLIHIESIVIDEVSHIYFDHSYDDSRNEFSIDIGDYRFPRILFKWVASGPAMVSLYYVNKFYIDLVNKELENGSST